MTPPDVRLWRRKVATAWIRGRDVTQEVGFLAEWSSTVRQGRDFSPSLKETGPAWSHSGEVLELLGPVCALQVFGTSEEVAERRGGLEKVQEVFNALLPLDRVQVFEGLETDPEALQKVGGYLEHVVARLRKAERALHDVGWQFNPDTRKVERTGAGNRPYGLRRKLFVRLAEAFSPDGKLQNTAEARRQISAFLWPFLPSEEVDPAKDGPLDRDLKNELKKRTPTA